MIKINANVKRYFDSHPKVNEFYFTADGLAFFGENLANVHAANLKKRNQKSPSSVAAAQNNSVTLITRDEVNAWTAAIAADGVGGGTMTPKQAAKADADGQLAAAKVQLTDAEAALTAAQAAQNTVNADTASTPAQKAAATKAVNKAAADVAAATANVSAAEAVVNAQ